jgi:hypothetical protein
MRAGVEEGALTVAPDGTNIVLNTKSARSPFAGAVGLAALGIGFRADARAITHRHVALKLSGSQDDERITIYRLAVEATG